MISILTRLEKIIPLSVLVVCLIIFIPFFGIGINRNEALFIHFLGYLFLGIFFEIPEFLLGITCLWMARDHQSLERNWERQLGSGAMLSVILVAVGSLFIIPLMGLTRKFSWVYCLNKK